MAHELTDMEYVVAAISQALYCGMTAEELIKVSQDAQTPEHFDQLVNEFTDHTFDPGVVIDVEANAQITGPFPLDDDGNQTP